MDELRQEPTAGQTAAGASDVLQSVALEAVRYDAATGLVPVVVQDEVDNAVLMVAYANREALKRTLGSGQAWFWSRSRDAYWRKGETSGNVLEVHEVRLDCDGDTVLYRVRATGPTCHTGSRSCFFRAVHREGPASGRADNEATGEGTNTAGAGDGRGAAELPHDAPKPLPLDALQELWRVVVDRDQQRPPGAYTTYLFEHGIDKIAKKVGEEAVEVAIAAKNAVAAHGGTSQARIDGQAELRNESADLLYHLLVLWKSAGIDPAEVNEILSQRARS